MREEIRRAIRRESERIGVEEEALGAFVTVESGGRGFDPTTGKILIQFEPHWFRRHEPYAPSGKWSVNRVEKQAREWEAFDDASRIAPESAMKSTSIGLGQVMGMHYQRLGYLTVAEMWHDAERGEDRQVYQMAEFVRTDSVLLKALKARHWHMVATRYNGAGYKAVAKRYGREPYDVSMRKAYNKLKGW